MVPRAPRIYVGPIFQALMDLFLSGTEINKHFPTYEDRIILCGYLMSLSFQVMIETGSGEDLRKEGQFY